MARAFIGIVTRDAAERTVFAKRLEQMTRTRPDLRTAFENDHLLVAAEGMEQTCDLGPRGVVLGRASCPADIGGDGCATATMARLIYYSRGATLIDRCWGNYVAVVAGADGGVDIVRAPLGDLPCYLLEAKNAVYISSNPRLLASFSDVAPTIDWPALARLLAFGHLRTSETCLAGITEVAGGERATIGASGVSRALLWSPWAWTAPEKTITDRHEAASRIRQTAIACVAESVRGHKRVLLKLSGGLDSSIVAACLAQAGISLAALTLVTDDASGDERDYANIVADHFRIDLLQAMRDPARVELMRSPSADLPRPSVPGFRLESDRLCAAAATRAGATAVLDGGGGDNVFCSLQSASPVADCILAPDGRRFLGKTARSVAAIAHVSTFHVLQRAVRRAFAPARDHRWPIDHIFLHPDMRQHISAVAPHPWLRRPVGALPGRAAHVALIAAGQSYVEGLDPETTPRLIAPLMAQPLVELCLRVPSWLWYHDCRNRAAARLAFSDDLPRRIVERRSKGSPDAFVAQILERNRGPMRDLLLDGALAQAQVIDRIAVAAVLDGNRPVGDLDLQRVMGLLDAEIWARGWKG